MESQGHVEFGAHQAYELAPKCRGEDWIAVRHHGLGNAVKPHDVREEGLRDGLGGVWVRQGNKVAILAEPVHHRQDDGLATDARQCLHEVERDVRPDTLGYGQGK